MTAGGHLCPVRAVLEGGARVGTMKSAATGRRSRGRGGTREAAGGSVQRLTGEAIVGRGRSTTAGQPSQSTVEDALIPANTEGESFVLDMRETRLVNMVNVGWH
jgi:hypothetical protein